MELKVWVEGVARVVSGLTQSTRCQDVVIALAQSIGRTGRYVLILKQRGTERPLLAEDCPLQVVAQFGQPAAEVQFVLQRTGPPLAEGQLQTGRNIRSPGPAEDRPPGRKSTSFPLSGNPKANRGWSSPAGFLLNDTSSNQELLRQILLQQRRLQELEEQLEVLERETELWSQRGTSAGPPDGPTLDVTEEAELLEQQLKHNRLELKFNEHLDRELEEETGREGEMRRRLKDVHSSLGEQEVQIQASLSRSALLEEQIKASLRNREEVQQMDATRRSLELLDQLQSAEEVEDTLKDTQRNTLRDTQRDTLRDTLRDTQRDTQRDTLKDTQRDTQRNTLRNTLRDTQRDTQRDTLKDTLRNTQKDTLRDTQRELQSADQRVKAIERQWKLQQFIQLTGPPPQGAPTNSLYLNNAGIKE